MKILIDTKPELIDVKNDDGKTSLHIATSSGLSKSLILNIKNVLYADKKFSRSEFLWETN